MRKTTLLFCAGLLLLCASGLMADTAQTYIFLTQLLPANETPTVPDDGSSANAIIYVHVIKDSNGNITSGSVDFDIATKFKATTTINGLHLHKGLPGVAGPILVPTDVANGDKSFVTDANGKVTIFKQVQFPQTAPNVDVATIVDLIANPSNFYVNIHTPDFPSGAMRGQLLGAEVKVVMGLMSTQNEIPPTGVNGGAVATVTVMRARDGSGNVAFAEAIFNMEYAGFDSAAGTAFTGFHIHNGGPTCSCPVVINTGMGGGANSVPIAASGNGNLNYRVPITPSDATFTAEVGAVNGLFDNPDSFYINVHTNIFGGGVARDQLRNTDHTTFQVNMLPSNETPPIVALAATGTAALEVFTLRDNDGTVAFGSVIFDVNFRGFPASTTITGLHIHDGAATVIGNVTISSGLGGGNTVVSDSGNGNIYKLVTVNTKSGHDTLNSIVRDPSQAYVNLHTTVNTGGAIRAQLGGAAAKPNVGGVAANASTIMVAAPGSILSIYGTGLASVQSGLNAFRGLTKLPTSLNGVSVTIAGVKAPLYFVSALQLNVQVPFEVGVGSQPLVVTTAGGISDTMNITVAAVAPSLFIVDASTGLGAVLKNFDFSLVTPANPVKGGDIVVIYSTGLGQTVPAALSTGTLVPTVGDLLKTTDVSVSFGGQAGVVVYSIASPGFTGLYQTAVTVPLGVSGPTQLVLRAGATASNQLTLAVQ